MNNKAVVAIYAHPEMYPPTLNAMTELAPLFDKVSLLFRPHMESQWAFADNVELLPSGPAISSRSQQQAPLMKRIGMFLQFVRNFRNLCWQERPSLVLLYDPLALLAYHWAKKLGLPKFKIWYHNHDVLETQQKKFSLNWWALRAKDKCFSELAIFSLPAEERKAYFPMEKFHGDYFFIPNLPSLSFYRRYFNTEKTGIYLKLFFRDVLTGDTVSKKFWD